MQMSDPAMKGSALGAAGRPTVVEKMDWFNRDTPNAEPAYVRDHSAYQNNYGKPPNSTRGIGSARSAGGNPITGQGYPQQYAPTAEPTFARDQPDYQNNFGVPQNPMYEMAREGSGDGIPSSGPGFQGYKELDPHVSSPTFMRNQPEYQNSCGEPQSAARANARVGGGNPITGQGYKEENVTHSQRRQFQQPLATKLW
jgi:hypothetical protein